MESKLIQGLFEHPGVINRRSEHHLRYALALAALDVFQPGAAKKGGRTKRPDIKVRSPQLAGWRRRVLTTLGTNSTKRSLGGAIRCRKSFLRFRSSSNR